MRLLLLTALAAISLTGCQTKSMDEMSYSEVKALSLEMHKRCWTQGVKDGSPEMKMCVDQELRRETSTRRNNAANLQAVGAALGNAGQSYSRSMQTNRTINCTSRRYGGAINTSCY